MKFYVSYKYDSFGKVTIYSLDRDLIEEEKYQNAPVRWIESPAWYVDDPSEFPELEMIAVIDEGKLVLLNWDHFDFDHQCECGVELSRCSVATSQQKGDE